MTLDEAGTATRVRVLSREDRLHEVVGNPATKIIWNPTGYVPPATGQAKVDAFLWNESLWRAPLEAFGFKISFPQTPIEILTRNTVPAGTGIATSASSFAALTLAWAAILVGADRAKLLNEWQTNTHLKQALAEIASKGSGSACRSMLGPWVEWIPEKGIHAIEGAPLDLVDLILLIEEEKKLIPSSEAHLRVQTSPLYSEGRMERAHVRLKQVKDALFAGEFAQLQKVVLEEALDMHELFHTSNPPFSYLRPKSREWIQRIKEQDPNLPSAHAVLTLDAGANVHLFVPSTEVSSWLHAIKEIDPSLKVFQSHMGLGAHYV